MDIPTANGRALTGQAAGECESAREDEHETRSMELASGYLVGTWNVRCIYSSYPSLESEVVSLRRPYPKLPTFFS